MDLRAAGGVRARGPLRRAAAFTRDRQRPVRDRSATSRRLPSMNPPGMSTTGRRDAGSPPGGIFDRLADPAGKRPMGWELALWIMVLMLPLAALELLLAAPELDMRWEHHPSHFWLVLAVAMVNVVLGLYASEAASRRDDARTFFVSLALLASAGFLGLHALATPGRAAGRHDRRVLAGGAGGTAGGRRLRRALRRRPRYAGRSRPGTPSPTGANGTRGGPRGVGATWLAVAARW
jgi:hypothetical protein